MSVRAARPEDVSKLEALWTEAFGEDEAFRTAFFKTHFQPENSLVFEEAHELCGMLHTVPCQICSRPARYLYAIATKKAFRNRGVFSALHAAARERFPGEAFFLIPENESLFSFYTSRLYRVFATRPCLTGELGEELSLAAAWELYQKSEIEGVRLTREQFETTALDKRFFTYPDHPFVIRLPSGEVTSFYPDASAPCEKSAMVLSSAGETGEITLPCFLN